MAIRSRNGKYHTDNASWWGTQHSEGVDTLPAHAKVSDRLFCR
jgi:hypothetical protein